MTTTDPPSYNNSGLYKLKYENFERNSEIRKFQSHENEFCVPMDLTNIHRDNSSCDTTATASTLTPNKLIDMTNNHRDNISGDMTTTDPTHPTNNSNDTTTTTTTMVPNFKPPDRIITIITTTTTTTTVLVTTTTTTTPNDDTQPQAQCPATNENSVTTPSLDPRLLVNTVLTKTLFTNIIREYSSNEPSNTITKFILSNSLQPQIQYGTKQPRPFYPINGNNLTPINSNNDSLVSLYNRELYSNFIMILKIFKQKTYNLKFGINQISNNSQSGKLIVLPPVKIVIVPAQGDTGANVSTTNDMSIIHRYFEYDTPTEVAVFSDESKTDVISLKAVGQGIVKIISDQGSVMNWLILYIPCYTGTVLLPDHYHQSNIS